MKNATSLIATTAVALAAGFSAVAALPASAGELYSPKQYQDAASTTTRAAVRRSVLEARRTGELNHNDIDLPGNGVSVPDAGSAFGRTRASVRADVAAARADGGLDHNDVDLPEVARGSQLTRRQVRDDVLASRTNQARTAPGRNTIEY